MPRGLKYLFLVLVLLLIGSVPLAMQFDSGSISGTVIDERRPVVNASLEARNIIGGVQAQTMSDMGGRYLLGELRQGRYSMWVRTPSRFSVGCKGGQTTTRDVYLRRRDQSISMNTLR